MTRAGNRAPALVALLALLCAAAGFLAGRATAPEGGHRPAGYLEQLAHDLDLRPSQVAAADEVLAAEDRDIDALLGEALTPLQARVAARRAQTEQRLLSLLDEAQRARWQALAAGAGGEAGGR